jgi:hypothetical protein
MFGLLRVFLRDSLETSLPQAPLEVGRGVPLPYALILCKRLGSLLDGHQLESSLGRLALERC